VNVVGGGRFVVRWFAGSARLRSSSMGLGRYGNGRALICQPDSKLLVAGALSAKTTDPKEQSISLLLMHHQRAQGECLELQFTIWHAIAGFIGINSPVGNA